MDGNERCVLRILASMIQQRIFSLTTAVRMAFLTLLSSLDSSIDVRLVGGTWGTEL